MDFSGCLSLRQARIDTSGADFFRRWIATRRKDTPGSVGVVRHSSTLSRVAGGFDVSRQCVGIGCDWQHIGSRWVPSFSSWPNGGDHDIEVEYMDYRCRYCGQTRSEERAYSQRPIQS